LWPVFWPRSHDPPPFALQAPRADPRTTARPRLDDEILATSSSRKETLRGRGNVGRRGSPTARLCFGGIEQMKEEHRDRRSVRWIETLASDFRYGLASLRRIPLCRPRRSACWPSASAPTPRCSAWSTRFSSGPCPSRRRSASSNVLEAPTPRVTTASPPSISWIGSGSTRVFEALAREDMTRVAVTLGASLSFLLQSRLRRLFPGVRCDRPARSHLQSGGGSAGAPASSCSVMPPGSEIRSRSPQILSRDLRLDGQPHRVIGVLPPGPFDVGTPAVDASRFHPRPAHARPPLAGRGGRFERA
jgi:hypothetical protein